MTQITFKNNPIHLLGTEVSEGQQAPDFKVLDNNLNEVDLSQFKDKRN
ncbi:thiol peroxidase [Staphylococcus petrasii]|nr:thiol peroxidase [Staphylococcus petrasii]